MANVGIFYGSTKGATKVVCEYVAKKLNAKLIDIKSVDDASSFEEFDTIILATSSYGFGELQGDWLDKIDILYDVNFDGKNVAFIGLGGLKRHTDSFCSSLVDFLPKIKHATIIGSSEVGEYKVENSMALINGKFIGLCVDFSDENWQKRADEFIKSL